MRRRFGTPLLALTVVLAACITESASPSPGSSSPGASASASVPASAPDSGSPSPDGSPSPTPPSGTPPSFSAGDLVETTASSVRVRLRPGLTGQILVQGLPVGAHLIVAMGPVMVDDYGWYQVRDADAADPAFTDGWVAAGFEPNPWLARSVFEVAFNPYVAGFAHDGDGSFGPVLLQGGGSYFVDWIAIPPGSSGCVFAVDLVPGGGEPVSAIRATLGAALAPGRLQTQFFSAHPELTGDVFVEVTTTCRWALTFVLVEG